MINDPRTVSRRNSPMAELSSWTQEPHRIAVDGKGYVWRAYKTPEVDGRIYWSMAPVNPDNSPLPYPVTFYEPAFTVDSDAYSVNAKTENKQTSIHAAVMRAERLERENEELRRNLRMNPMSDPVLSSNPPKPTARGYMSDHGWVSAVGDVNAEPVSPSNDNADAEILRKIFEHYGLTHDRLALDILSWLAERDELAAPSNDNSPTDCDICSHHGVECSHTQPRPIGLAGRSSDATNVEHPALSFKVGSNDEPTDDPRIDLLASLGVGALFADDDHYVASQILDRLDSVDPLRAGGVLPSNDNGPTVYDEVRAERERAHAKHGETSMEDQPVDALLRLSILMEEVGEVAKEFNDGRHSGVLDMAAVRKELIQVAAMSAAWADAIYLDFPTKEQVQNAISWGFDV